MFPSVRALLSEWIDYAGLFPPAQLPLDRAVEQYARLRSQPESWMLGRFVCPVGQLANLARHVGRFARPPTLRLSLTAEVVLGADSMDALLAPVRAFAREHGWWARIDAFELRLAPGSLAGEDVPSLAERLNVMADRFLKDALPSPSIFIEPPLNVERAAAIGTLSDALAHHNTRHGAPAPYRTGLKLRCGGESAAAIPSVAEVRLALAACCAATVPLKFTAGLHHPVRHFDAELGASLHGFLNLCAAGVLHFNRGLDDEALTAILSEEDAGAFGLDAERLTWRGYEASPGEINAARSELVVAMGSCSFDEPRDDLRRLGIDLS